MLPFRLCVALVVVRASILAAAESRMEAYLVHVRNDAMPTNSAIPLASWHASLLSAAFLLNSSSFSSAERSLLYSYRASFPGFAALLSPSQASRLSASDAVVALHKNGVARSHTTRTPSFLGLASSLSHSSQSSIPGPLWSASSQGLNTVIGLIDSGIWPHHPSFDDSVLDPITDHRSWTGICDNSFPCNRKIIGARYYFKGYEAATGHPIDKSREFKSPFDNNGHGTHTSGTAAGSFVANASFFGLASGTASGIAPLARISVYKVCWEMGEACTYADILAAFDDAISDGVDVISVSLGSPSSTDYSIDTVAIGAFAAVSRGILVTCSAGNDGPELGTVTNGPPWILTVAASTLDRDFPAPVTLGDGAVYKGTSLYVGGHETPTELKPLIYAGDAAAAGVDVTNASLCVSADYLNRTEVTGKLVVCEDGTVTRVEKGLAVKKAGGVGVIVSNPSIYGEMLQSSPNIAPGTQVGFVEGTAIRQYIDGSGDPTSTPKARIDFDGTRLGGRAPAMAAFSSRGPHLTSIGVLKPDVTAPGLNVLAAWTAVNSPSELDLDTRRVLFNIISGTSMSCPHLAGLGALLKAAHPTWSPAAIRSALMTTATVLDNAGEPIVDTATSEATDPFAYGSGHVRPNLALDPGLIYDIQVQGYVDFLCALDSSLLEVYKGSNSYTCSDPLPQIGDLNYPSFSVAFHQSAHNSSNPFSATFSRSLTNVGSPNSSYVVSITAPEFVDVSISPSTLSFDSKQPILSYSITFVASILPSLRLGAYHFSFGSLSWTDAYSHIVQSPILFTWY